MARLIVFSFFMGVFGSAVTTPIEFQPGVYNDQKAAVHPGCDQTEFFNLFMQSCRALPGTAAVNDVCPRGTRMTYTYRGDKYCNNIVPIDWSSNCPKGKYFDVVVARCKDLDGIAQVNNACPAAYITYSRLGEDRCFKMIRGVCTGGEVYEKGLLRCMKAPGVKAVDNKCAADEILYIYYDHVSRCLPVLHV